MVLDKEGSPGARCRVGEEGELVAHQADALRPWWVGDGAVAAKDRCGREADERRVEDSRNVKQRLDLGALETRADDQGGFRQALPQSLERGVAKRQQPTVPKFERSGIEFAPQCDEALEACRMRIGPRRSAGLQAQMIGEAIRI